MTKLKTTFISECHKRIENDIKKWLNTLKAGLEFLQVFELLLHSEEHTKPYAIYIAEK